VVHVDGNGIGTLIARWLKACSEEGVGDETVRTQYGDWSAALDQAWRVALEQVVRRVTTSVQVRRSPTDSSSRVLADPMAGIEFTLKEEAAGHCFLPLRPVLLGGDDLTFLCDGRIALDLASTALSALERDIPHLGTISASAGVALVRSHAPIIRAYALAEALCGSAKRMLRDKGVEGSALDWHVGAPRPGEVVAEIRHRQYRRDGLELTCRPYRLGRDVDDRESWRWLAGRVLGGGAEGFRGRLWARRRNKIKELGVLAREGPEGVRQGLEAWRVVEPNLRLADGAGQDGFIDGRRTPLLDAVELVDLHMALAREAEEAQ
jgi:hypothetical protein